VHQVNHKIQGRKLGIAIFLNLLITLSQVIGGLISGSIALLSDALHNFSDVMALILSYLAGRLSLKKNTPGKTFGFKRAELMAAFINASTLIVIAVYLMIEAIQRFREPQEIESSWIIWLAALSILLNGISVWILHSDSKHSMNIKSAYIHLLTDMFTSVAVLVGGILISMYKLYWIDGLLTLLIAGYIIFSIWQILIDSLKMLMLFTPSGIELDEIRDRISRFKEVANIHHVHAWHLNDNQIHFEAHIDFNEDLPLSKIDELLGQIREVLSHEYHLHHVTLQPEYDRCDKKDLISEDH
jgi:cobalt-zinc-cadmium efflux system protein